MKEEGGRKKDGRGEGERWTREVRSCHSEKRERRDRKSWICFHSVEFPGALVENRKRRSKNKRTGRHEGHEK